MQRGSRPIACDHPAQHVAYTRNHPRLPAAVQLPAARCLLLVACSAILRNPVPAEAYTQFSVLGRQDLRNWGDQQERQQTTPMLPSDPATLQREFGGIMHTEHAYLAISGAGVLERAGHPA